MDAWRTSCPRLSVWEDAVLDELVRIDNGDNRAVTLTPRGRAVLEKGQNAGARSLASLGQHLAAGLRRNFERVEHKSDHAVESRRS